MRPESMPLYLNLSTGFYLLAMVVEVVGCLVCLRFRHLSGWTILAALGFAGMFTAGVTSRLITLGRRLGDLAQVLMGPLWVIGAVLFFVSMIALVGGLWKTFVELQRRLAMALEPKDGWQ